MRILLLLISFIFCFEALAKPKIKLKPGEYKLDLIIYEDGKKSEMYNQMKTMLKSMPKAQRDQMIKMSKSMMKADINFDQLLDERFCHKDNLDSSLSQFGVDKKGCTQKIVINTEKKFKGSFDCKSKGSGSFDYSSKDNKSFNADIKFSSKDTNNLEVKISGSWVKTKCK